MPSPRLQPALLRLFGPARYGRMRIRGFHLKGFLQNGTPRRMANLAMNRIQRCLRRDNVVGMPTSYFVDPINVCMLRCPLCPTGREELTRPAGRMIMADLRRIIDEIAPEAYRVELYNWGEPLLHPDIFDMIEYASQRRLFVGLSSNLNRLEAGAARRLVESGLSQLVVSIDGATQETYTAYRRRGELNRVLENLRLLLQARQTLGASNPFIVWQMLVGKHNEHEIGAVRDMAYDIGVDAFTTGALFVDTQDPDQVERWLPTDPAYTPYDYEAKELRNTWDCRDLWESMVINWDGGVAPCCWLTDPQFDFGNVRRQSVREIWHGPMYTSARRVIGRHQGQAGDTPTICHRCRGHPHYMAY